MTELAREHRQLALDRLAAIERELAAISTWLSGLGEDQAAEALDYGARECGAAGLLLGAPLRHRGVTPQRAAGP